MYNITRERTYPTPYSDSSLLPLLLMSLAIQKHTPDTKKSIRKEYDYIVVGAGAAGSVVASRLSEMPCVRVLLLEAGKSPPLLTDVPGIARSFINTDIDWQYKTTPQKHAGLALNNRQVQFPSGKTVGGSSVINSMFFVRGNRRNYDDWVKQGATGWDYAKVLPYFKKLEHELSHFSDTSYHGYSGPVATERPRYDSRFRRAVSEAATNLGYPFLDNNGAFQNGFADYTMAAKTGQRFSAGKAYLVPAENRTNLDIVAETLATKVIIEGGRATGVEIEVDGQRRQVRARREVILSAGALNTPKLLMLSGIGPKDHLQEMKIPLVVDLPVGQNLHDHCATLLPYTITDDIEPFPDKLSNKSNIQRYIDNRVGPLSSTHGEVHVAFLTNDRAPVNSLPAHQLYFFEAIPDVAKNQVNVKHLEYELFFGPFEKSTSVWCISQILNPRSRGSVTLASSDVHDPPVIDPNYYDNPQDVTDVVEGLKHCEEILSQGPLKKLNIKPYPTVNLLGLPASIDIYLRVYVKTVTVTIYHPVGTAKMGNPKDRGTVVDPELRVLGVKGLRVIDASVMPIIPSGNTCVPTMMVAEKASDIIKQSIQCSK